LLNKVFEITRNENLRKILEESYVTLELLKQAYISSRYLPFDYDEKVAKKSYELTKTILNVLGIL
jgi:hypothetical protein